MKLNFKKIEIHNFLSFADEVISFEDYKGMTRIKGFNYDDKQLNGSGKSAISNALVYGLFGQLSYKLKNENVYNRYLSDHNTRVCVYFDVSKKHYKVVSGLKGKQSYCNVYEILKDGVEKDLSKSSIAETRKFIEDEILHCDLNMFMRTVVLNDDEDYNFYKLKNTDKKEFIDKLFDISIFGDMYQLIHRDVLNMEKDITALQNQLIILNKNSDDLKLKVEKYESDKENRIKLLTAEKDNISKIFDEKSQNTIVRNEELVSKCNDAIKKIDANIEKLTDTLRKNEYSIKISKTTINNIISSIKDKNKIIEKHSELYNKLCEDCKGIFSDYHNLNKYKEEIQKLTDKKDSELNSQNELTVKNTEIQNNIIENKEKRIKLVNKLTEINSEYEKEQKELKNLEIQINSLVSNLNNVINSSNPYTDLQTENKDNITKVNNSLNDIVEKYKYIKFSESIVNQDNLKKFIIKDMIGMLNNKIKFYLHKLGASYDIVFDENMNYEFVTSAKSGVEFNNFSKGEKARITIATCFAFRDFLSTRSSISSNIFILDEFFDGNVDPMALENIVEILKDFVNVDKQKIFIVSHRAEISDEIFNKILMVEKRKCISTLKNVST